MRIDQVLFDKANHHSGACHVHVFSQIESVIRCFVSKLARFAGLAGLIATNLPFVPDV